MLLEDSWKGIHTRVKDLILKQQKKNVRYIYNGKLQYVIIIN